MHKATKLARRRPKDKRIDSEVKRRAWLIRALINKHGGACAICGEQVSLKEPDAEDYATIDHVIARSRGGPEDIANLRLAHRGCNEARGNDPD